MPLETWNVTVQIMWCKFKIHTRFPIVQKEKNVKYLTTTFYIDYWNDNIVFWLHQIKILKLILPVSFNICIIQCWHKIFPSPSTFHRCLVSSTSTPSGGNHCHHKLVLPVFETDNDKICPLRWRELPSFNIMFLRFIHTACISNSLFFVPRLDFVD